MTIEEQREAFTESQIPSAGEHKKALLETVERYICRDLIGNAGFCTSDDLVFSADELRIIADELDRLNKEQK